MKCMALALICLLLAAPAWSQENAQVDGDMITVPRSELDALKERLDQLEREVRDLKASQARQETTEPAVSTDTVDETAPNTTAEAPVPEPAGGRQLALPDISFIAQAKGKLTDDENDPDRQKVHLSEAELGIQGYVYPNVKADAFITGSPAEDEPFQVEEAYLTYLGLTNGLNFYVGQKHVAFGRTNLLHSHSWPYVRQPYVLSNFVSPESLTGQGLAFSYLIPTRSSFFAQLDLGTWANGSEGEESNPPDIVSGPGANLTDRFSTARLWTGYPVSENGELELGGSWAGGKSEEDPATLESDHVTLTGVDLSYRHFGEGSKRLLLRAESFWRHGTTDANDATRTGYYLLGDYRLNRYNSVGLLYDWSGFPQDTTLHESALSLIYTRQFSEQYYVRFQAVHGDRPDCGNFNELWLQWVWGVGPHTHNLE